MTGRRLVTASALLTLAALAGSYAMLWRVTGGAIEAAILGDPTSVEVIPVYTIELERMASIWCQTSGGRACYDEQAQFIGCNCRRR